MKSVQFLRALMVVLFTAPRQATRQRYAGNKSIIATLGADQSCNVTQVQECYSTILDNVVGVLSSHKPDRSLHQNICTQLEAGLHRCLIAPDLTCQNHRRRATLARKTLATLLEARGCDPSSAGTANVEDSTGGEKCWYKQLKRCNERQIKEIRTKMTKLTAKNMLPHERSIAGICRRTRKTCHQHSRVASCVTREQDAIRQLEEAMDEAQALLCKDDSALLKNLLLSYKWWDIDHFTKCSTDIQVTSITDFLYNRIRIRSDCRVLKSRLFRCLEQSYAEADEAEPKPNVEGARMVLAIFLDRMKCIEAVDLPPDDGATSGPDDTDDDDYPAAGAGGNETDINDSAMTAVLRDAESGAAFPEIRMWGLAFLVSLIIVLAQG